MYNGQDTVRTYYVRMYNTVTLNGNNSTCAMDRTVTESANSD